MNKNLIKIALFLILSSTLLASPRLTSLSPLNQTVIYKDTVQIKGSCKNTAYVYVNNEQVGLVEGKFQHELLFDNYGKKTVFITLFDKKGKKNQKRINLLYLKKFKDLQRHSLKNLVEILATLKYFPNDYGIYFQPEKRVEGMDKTSKNSVVWQKAIKYSLDRERLAILLFKDKNIQKEIDLFTDWYEGFPSKLKREPKPPKPKAKPKTKAKKVSKAVIAKKTVKSKVKAKTKKSIAKKSITKKTSTKKQKQAAKDIKKSLTPSKPITQNVKTQQPASSIKSKPVKKKPIAESKKQKVKQKAKSVKQKSTKLDPTVTIIKSTMPKKTKKIVKRKKKKAVRTVQIKKDIKAIKTPAIATSSFEVLFPVNDYITTKTKAQFKVSITGKSKHVLINNKKYRANNKGLLNRKIELKVGKNLVSVAVPGSSQPTVNKKILHLKAYKDLAKSKHKNADLLNQLGALKYFPWQKNFKPGEKVLKEEMAMILAAVTGKKLSKLKKDPFRDVSQSYWAASQIKSIVDQDLIGVYPDGYFRPKEKLSRYQALIILSRLEGLNFNAVKVGKAFPFKDVEVDSALAKVLQAALDSGLIQAEENFNGSGDLTRETLALMLSRVSTIKRSINNLLDWKVGCYE